MAGNFPVILTGDFNYSHTSDPYNIMIGVCGFSDSYNIALQNASPWVTSTRNGFTFGYTTDPAGRIDHIFLKGSNNHDFIVNKYTISDFYYTDNNGKKRYPSDHFPVIIELEYKKIE
ncbi:MAG: endonuclease/exonuclease/phosphatase family protein [Bacteroidales bacterium]|nr:endonuclease/exonuclease/phosphatase family protein [Bacteroidales bacterium]